MRWLLIVLVLGSLSPALFAQNPDTFSVPTDKQTIKAYSRQLRDQGLLDVELTDAEVEVISKYPDRAQRVAEISLDATIRAKQLYKDDRTIPEDVYRHIFWSYWLTKEYGPEFAELVTDAHEIGDTHDTPGESLKDMLNNKLGRDYALRGYSEEEVIERIKTDPDVKRKPLD